ncbi:MAG: prepilin-type N-terminal cleavage/methylation domain-containing protein [Sumerlaeia bacterium]
MTKRAFTLIELLIVVAIIAILAAIATVNLQNAQVRGKLARAHSDIRTLHGAMAAYRTDHGAYPPAAIADLTLFEPLTVLTSPVAYLTSIPRDPFGPASYDFNPTGFQYWGYNYKDAATTSDGLPGETYGYIWDELPNVAYMIHSAGPNQIWDVTPYVEYDATNGLVSVGDIARFEPE